MTQSTTSFSFQSDAILCISLAERPSKFGYTIFNTAFQHEQLNMMYKPLQVTSDEQLAMVIEGIRGFNIRGCGASMPWKTKIMQYLDSIDPVAQKIGAINTIVNDNGTLLGYNTDYFAAKKLFSEYGVKEQTTILLLGTGGVAKAIVTALHELNADITVCCRTEEHALDFAQQYKTKHIAWNERNTYTADVLVNATPTGMTPDDTGIVIDPAAIINFTLIADLVIKPANTKLITLAKERHKKTIPGYMFTLQQAIKQFELYTGKPAPSIVMEQAMQELLR